MEGVSMLGIGYKVEIIVSFFSWNAKDWTLDHGHAGSVLSLYYIPEEKLFLNDLETECRDGINPL